MPENPLLSVRDVSVAFGITPILRHVHLDVAAGEIVALLGPSGSGKSTLLRAIAGLIDVDSGSVWIDGRDVGAIPTHRRGIGFVFQDDQLFPHRSVAQNVEFGLRVQGWKAPARHERVDELLDLVGLPGFGERRVTELSGGEAKRVALARTLAPAPRLVLLDEPLTGLDRDLHDQLADELGTLLARAGSTAVLVTHDPAEAASVADRSITLGELSRPAG